MVDAATLLGADADGTADPGAGPTADPGAGPTADPGAGPIVDSEGASSASALVIVTRSVDFETFFAQHRMVVAKTLSMTLGDEQLGYEAADEAMARAYERWTTVSSYTNPEGWVYRTGLNWARSWLRRRSRGRTKDQLLASPESGVDRTRDIDLARALTKLNDDQRAVVVLRYYRDWSVEQTAAALDIAPGTVKSRLSRAMHVLQEELSPVNPG